MVAPTRIETGLSFDETRFIVLPAGWFGGSRSTSEESEEHAAILKRSDRCGRLGNFFS
jgi:hypothetical protein